MGEVVGGTDPSVPPTPKGRSRRDRLLGFLFDVRVLRVLGQLAAIGVLIALALYLRDNYLAQTRGAGRGFGFLDEPTGFDQRPDVSRGDPVGDALLLGARNTAASAVVGMLLAMIVGVVVGIIRLSRSWVARQASTLYVEVLRNVPVLLIILFVNAWLATLPQINRPRDIGVLVYSNRQISVLSPVMGDDFWTFVGVLVAAILVALVLARWRTAVSETTGEPHHRLLWGLTALLVVVVPAYLALAPLSWSLPEVGDRVVVGGLELRIPYVAITLALGLYHGSHIAEIVRGSILAVPHGQSEAATAVGLSDFQRMRFVILPQAFRIAVPPTINQLLSLTKNTSLGIVVAYSDLFSLGFRVVSIRAPAVETMAILMAVYLMFSLFTSLVLNIFNRRLQLVER